METLLLLLAGKNSDLTATGSLSMLASNSSAPEVSETSMESHLLHSLKVLTKSTVKQVRVFVR